MRRLIAFAAFFLIVSVVPVCAQRGGGHAASGGSHGGFSGGHSSFSGGHVGGGFGGHAGGFGSPAGFAGHGAMGAGSHFVSRMGSGRSFGRGGYGHYGGRYDHRFRNRFAYGYGYGYPYAGYYSYLPGIDPYWWWDTYPSDDAGQREMADEMNQENLEEQQALREQDQDAYAQARPMRRQAEPAASKEADNDLATVLVYRDQHQREVRNYAIVDDLIYVFTPQRTERVPLSVIDVPATIRANQDRGLDFRLPGVSEGQ